jgi:hypothetical protein
MTAVPCQRSSNEAVCGSDFGLNIKGDWKGENLKTGENLLTEGWRRMYFK